MGIPLVAPEITVQQADGPSGQILELYPYLNNLFPRLMKYGVSRERTKKMPPFFKKLQMKDIIEKLVAPDKVSMFVAQAVSC